MNAEETLKILLQVRSLIETPETWLQGMFAVRADGTPCSPHSPAAKQFCLEAALVRVIGSSQLQMPHLAILQASGTASLVELNDDYQHCEVLRAIDMAIARVSETPRLQGSRECCQTSEPAVPLANSLHQAAEYGARVQIEDPSHSNELQNV